MENYEYESTSALICFHNGDMSIVLPEGDDSESCSNSYLAGFVAYLFSSDQSKAFKKCMDEYDKILKALDPAKETPP